MSLLIYGHSRSLVSPRPSGFRHEARRRGNYPPKSSRRPKRFLSLSAASVAPLHACIACLVSSPPHHADPSQCLSHPPRWNRSWVGERIHEYVSQIPCTIVASLAPKHRCSSPCALPCPRHQPTLRSGRMGSPPQPKSPMTKRRY